MFVWGVQLAVPSLQRRREEDAGGDELRVGASRAAVVGLMLCKISWI